MEGTPNRLCGPFVLVWISACGEEMACFCQRQEGYLFTKMLKVLAFAPLVLLS